MKRFIVTVDQRVRFQYEVEAPTQQHAMHKVEQGKAQRVGMTVSPHRDAIDFSIIDVTEIPAA